jgi:hypothetical protein
MPLETTPTEATNRKLASLIILTVAIAKSYSLLCATVLKTGTEFLVTLVSIPNTSTKKKNLFILNKDVLLKEVTRRADFLIQPRPRLNSKKIDRIREWLVRVQNPVINPLDVAFLERERRVNSARLFKRRSMRIKINSDNPGRKRQHPGPLICHICGSTIV